VGGEGRAGGPLSSRPLARQAGKPEADSRVRRYDPQETRTRVLEAAYMLFGTRGYASTGTADIAREADVSEGSIFYHFGSKRALLAELGKLHGQRMIAFMQGDNALDELTFEVTLTRCFAFSEINRGWEQTVGGDCAQSAARALKETPEAEPFFQATRQIVVDWTRAHMDAVSARHGATPVDTAIAASLIFSLVADAHRHYFDPEAGEEDRRRILAECIRFCTAAAGHPANRQG